MTMRAFALFISLMSLSAVAGDVKPGEKLGTLIVTAPPGFSLNNANVYFRIDNVSSAVKLGVENKVAAGTGCVEVKYDQKYKYEASYCAVVINEKATTTVELAALRLSWDPKMFDVDFGPIPDFLFSTGDTVRKIQGKFKPYGIPLNEVALLLPAMMVNMDLFHPHTGVLSKQSIALSDGRVTDFPIQLSELRGTLHVHFVDGAPTFDTPDILKGNFAAIYQLQPNSDTSVTELPPSIRTSAEGRGGRRDGSWEDRYVFNHFKFSTNGADQELKAFPVILSRENSSAFLGISLNEFTIPVNLKSGQILNFSVATLNVYHYKSNLPGEFEVFANLDKRSNDLVRIRFPSAWGSDYKGPMRVPTQKSIFVPYGFKYRLDFYAKDELGRVTLQDQIMQDLTIAP